MKGPAAVVVSPEGNYDILALVEQSGKENAWLMEIDKNNGNKQWEFIYDANTYGSTISTFGTKLFLDTFGNYFVFGKINDAANPAVNLFVLKLSSRGEKLWSHLFRYPKGQSSHADDILKIGKDIYLFGTILDDQVVGSNSIFMMKLTEN